MKKEHVVSKYFPYSYDLQSYPHSTTSTPLYNPTHTRNYRSTAPISDHFQSRPFGRYSNNRWQLEPNPALSKAENKN